VAREDARKNRSVRRSQAPRRLRRRVGIAAPPPIASRTVEGSGVARINVPEAKGGSAGCRPSEIAAPGLPGGAIAQGSIFSIFGTNLGPASSPALAFPLVTTLGGVSIKVTQGTNSVNAIPLFVSPGQINALMPSNTPLGLVSVQATLNGKTGNPSPVRVVASSLGIFS